MRAVDNIFACLVHENPECVIDLVRNLHYLDPASLILLYNGSRDEHLLNCEFPFERYGAVIHPKSRPNAWGRLHDFALDSMTFALENFVFRTLTIVDSDQLSIRANYSGRLAAFASNRANLGMLGNAAAVQPLFTRIGPAEVAYREIELWRPFLRRFKDGEKKFPWWSFWPSTVFTNEAAKELTTLFATDKMLQYIMSQTKIWASEEVILPSLVALLGYEVCCSPFSYDYVQYRKTYSVQQIGHAQARPDVYWIHPVPRRYDNILRDRIRNVFGNYELSCLSEEKMDHNNGHACDGLLLTWPILMRMKRVEGWLAEDEADLLVAAASKALTKLPAPHAVVEIGSYCGRSTVVLASVLKTLCPESRVYAIDPHDGKVGALDTGIQTMPPTLTKLKYNLEQADLTDVVSIIPQRSWEVSWDKPISLLLIDGLHDYTNVARDFFHFESLLVPGAYVAFHDYADYYPGVKVFVDELLKNGKYQKVACASSMIIVQGITLAEAAMALVTDSAEPVEAPFDAFIANPEPLAGAAASAAEPLVSCIMPTADRPGFVPQAISYFLRQDYTNRELIILDDGANSISEVIPVDSRIRYVRLNQKLTMGAKHNLACEMAHGSIIVHWDDDDWMSNCRLSYQVSQLVPQQPMTLSGLSRLLFYEPQRDKAWEYVYPVGDRSWVCGGTFCYRKELWEKHRFPAMNEGADTVYVWGLRNTKVLTLPDNSFYVGIVHPRNTSHKRTGDPRWHACSSQRIRDLMQADWIFYQTNSDLPTKVSSGVVQHLVFQE
jgi:hypothetical protein